MPSLKLNLGAGRDKRLGWVNVDALPELEPDLVHDLSQPLPFANNSASQVLAQDILEHFTKEDVRQVVAEIARVLKPGGVLEVRVPNIDDIIERFAGDKEARNQFLYGTTEETGIFGAHKVGFTPESICTLMIEHNLYPTSFRQETTNFAATFEKRLAGLEITSLLVVIQTLSMGGAEVFWADLLQAFQQKSIDLVVYTNLPAFKQLLVDKGIRAEHLPVIIDIIGDWKGLLKGLVLLPYALLVYGRILYQHKRADAVLLSGFGEKIGVTLVARVLSMPVVWFEFGPIGSVLNKFSRLPKALYYLVKSIPETIIVPSKNTFNYLIAEAHVSLSKLVVVPCGRAIPAPRKKLKRDSETIVCVSRLQPGKGHDLLLQAFARVLKKRKQARLVVVGRGDAQGAFQRSLERQAADLRISHAVTFTGRVADPLSYFETASIAVFPSVWEMEGFGLVLIEAMALGCPVVAFATGPIPEIIQPGRNGLLTEKGNVQDLAAQLLQLLDQPRLRQKLARQEQHDFQEKYQISQVAERYLTHIRRGMSQHRAQQLIKELWY